MIVEGEAERWEAGCKADRVRNAFVIPEVSRIIARHKPETVLDIGAGTGYIARGIQARLQYFPRWTLIDSSASRLAIADRERPPHMNQDIVVGDFGQYCFPGGPADAAIVAFTLLEVEDLSPAAVHLARLVRAGGTLIILLPDGLEDVMQVEDPGTLKQFRSGRASIQKTDKFTDRAYPFNAHRIEAVIEAVLGQGFKLFEMTHHVVDESTAYLLAFERTVEAGST